MEIRQLIQAWVMDKIVGNSYKRNSPIELLLNFLISSNYLALIFLTNLISITHDKVYSSLAKFLISKFRNVLLFYYRASVILISSIVF
jgi:hypothetical protein